VIVDTSALIAILRNEVGYEQLRDALTATVGVIPAPVLVEFERVTALAGNARNATAWIVVEEALHQGLSVAAFDGVSARAAVEANARFGSGCGHEAKLNMLDLMVYGMAKSLDMPILCTGRDFAATDAAIHPASRID
jgi:ribonuclease VapC